MLLTGFYSGQAQQNKSLQDSLKGELIRHPADTSGVRILERLAKTYSTYHYDSMYYFADQALQLAHRLDDRPGIGYALITENVCLVKKGDYSGALALALKGLKVFEDNGPEDGVAYSCLQIAQTYKEIGADKMMREYLAQGVDYSKRAYSLYEYEQDTAEMAESLNEAGIIYHDLAQGKRDHRYYDSAFLCYTRALELIERSGKGTNFLGRLYNNTSQIYAEGKKDYPGALQYVQKAITLNEKTNNVKSLSFNYSNAASIYDRMGDGRHSLEYARKSLAMAQILKFPERYENAYFQLVQSYKAVGRYDSALYYYALYHRLSDSMLNLDKTSQIAEMQTKYESVKKEGVIQRLNIDNNNKNGQILLLIGGLIVAFLIVGALLWLYRRVSKQKLVISRQSKQLETVMKELHHRVKNNLQIVSSLLSLQSYRLNDAEAIAAIKQSQQRVQAMGLIHQRLYQTDESALVNIKEYITDLVESLLSSYGYDRDQFDLLITAEQDLLDVDKVLMLGLIVNEIVTNAFKYAYKDTDHPSLRIACREHGEHIILSIKDNGAGWDASKWRQAGGSFGKQLVTALCKQLRATQELTMDNGTQFTFIIPRQAQIA
ncbi:MAG TPA: histidine kinase dimerization/phosphoacceptor domain -containing protein [Puia sp.]|nr:histidine kinase dimerization/phosphoacceptor domain -containing protein [Puia sp.]